MTSPALSRDARHGYDLRDSELPHPAIFPADFDNESSELKLSIFKEESEMLLDDATRRNVVLRDRLEESVAVAVIFGIVLRSCL